MLDLVIDQWSTFLYPSIQYDGHLHDYKINSTHYVHHRCHQFQRSAEAHKYFINDHPDHNICFVAIHWRDRCQPMTPDNIIFCHKTPHTRHPVLHMYFYIKRKCSKHPRSSRFPRTSWSYIVPLGRMWQDLWEGQVPVKRWEVIINP